LSEDKNFQEMIMDIGGVQPPYCHRQSKEAWLSAYPQWVANANELQQPYYKEPFPAIPLTFEEQETFNLYYNDINTYVNEMKAKFILGNESLDKFDDYVNALKKLNIDELIRIQQQRYDRYLKMIDK
jgi:putative aldouronate transport system substrate-binding protein